MSSIAEQLGAANDKTARSVTEKSKALKQQWDILLALADNRIRLGLSYVNFHKKAQQVF